MLFMMPKSMRFLTSGWPVEETESSASEASGTRWSGLDHAVNIRASLPLLFGHYYVVVLAGNERRGAERRKEERQKHPPWTAANTIFLFAAGLIVGVSVFLPILTIWIFGLDGR